MRILHLITRMDRGGSAVNTLISALKQVEQGHYVVLATGLSEESEMSADELRQVEKELENFQGAGGILARIPALKRGFGLHDWTAFQKISELIASGGFDIIHTHTSKAGVLGRLAGRGRGKVVHTPHGHIFHGYFSASKTKLFIAVERWMADKSDALIALTEAEKTDHLALNIGHEKQWHVIPSGVDVAMISEKVRELRQQNNGEVLWDAVSVGRLVPIKGMERLIRAWAEVCKEKPDAKLAVVGDGDQRSALEKLATESGISGNVYFAGWADPMPYLAAARCFTLLSHNEGMGRAVVEAFAASLPCVVSDVCGLSELVDDTVGCVVDSDDAQQVARALLSEWSPKMRENTRRRAEYYSVEAMIDGLSAVYEQLLSG